MWGFNESLEKAKKDRLQAEYLDNEKNKLLTLENDFNQLDSTKEIKANLEKLTINNNINSSDVNINFSEKEKIESRLLSSYQKNPESFNYEKSLEKIFFWDKTNLYWWSWIFLEWDKVKIFKQLSLIKNKNSLDIYNEYLNTPSDNPEDDNYDDYGQVEKAKDTGPTTQEQFEKIDNWLLKKPHAKLVKRLNLNKDLEEKLNKEIVKTGSLNENKLKSAFIWLKSNSTQEWIRDNWKKLDLLMGWLKKIPENRESIPQQNIDDFNKDFETFWDIAENWIYSNSYKNAEPKPDKFEIKSYELISENYIKIWNTIEDNESNFNTAIELAATWIMNSWANIEKNDTYKKAVININSDSRELKLEWLNTLVEMEHKSKIQTAKKFIKTYPKNIPKKKERENYRDVKKKLNSDPKYIKDNPLIKNLSKLIRNSFEILWWWNEKFNQYLDNLNIKLKSWLDLRNENDEQISEIIKEWKAAIKEN